MYCVCYYFLKPEEQRTGCYYGERTGGSGEIYLATLKPVRSLKLVVIFDFAGVLERFFGFIVFVLPAGTAQQAFFVTRTLKP